MNGSVLACFVMDIRTICVLAAAFAPLAARAADPHMTSQEREKTMALLAESKKQFMAAIDGVSDQQWTWKPAPERWSVGETAEHIVLSERLLFGAVERALASPPNPDWESKTGTKAELLEKVLPARRGKAQAPDPLVPTGKMSKAEVLAKFDENRARVTKFTQDTDAPLKQHTMENPFFKTLNAYDWLIYVPFHTQRHVKQIDEVKATAGYPAQ